MEEKKSYGGRVPYGFKRGSEGLEVESEDAKIVKKVFDFFSWNPKDGHCSSNVK
jgi:uncharacterized protein YfaP (DUF2135 family)